MDRSRLAELLGNGNNGLFDNVIKDILNTVWGSLSEEVPYFPE